MEYSDLPKKRQQEVLGQIIKDILIAQGLSYREFAPRMAWSHSQLGHIIAGRRNLDFLDWVALCKALEISSKEFLDKLFQEV